MKNRYRGKCGLCGTDVPPKAGRWRLSPKSTQDFTGLRCLFHSFTTTKNYKRDMKKRESLKEEE